MPTLPTYLQWTQGLPSNWRKPLLRLAIVWLALFALFFRDWAEMVSQWWDSSTYNHILLIPLILIWLVRLRWDALQKIAPSTWWPGLLLLAGAVMVWVLGAVSGLNLLTQAGAVGSLMASVTIFLGVRVSVGLIFPLCYMALLVPFGDEMVPFLQLITAKLTIALTHLSGVPAQIEGVFINTPGGLFEVAEACSGVKFLIAMIALGVLVAHVCFRSWKRRIAFMAVAIVLPVLANGVRAWGTIYIAQSQGIEFASGFDHIFYGWIFFGIIMAMLLGVAWRFFDRPGDDPFIDAETISSSPFISRLAGFSMRGWSAVLAAALIVVAGQAWSYYALRLEAPMPVQITFPEVPGWTRVDYAPQIWWEPRARGANHRLIGSYQNAAGDHVDISFALYSSQEDGREAGSFGEGALVPNTQWRWLEPYRPLDGGHAEWLQANGNVRRLAVTWYRTGNVLTGSNARLKLANITDRLIGRDNSTMALIISAEERPEHPAPRAIEAFYNAAKPLGQWMDGMAQTP